MVKINEYININKLKPVEIAYELKGDEYKVPSYEEFMKSYEGDGKVNYDDLGHSDIGDIKGCGPTTTQLLIPIPRFFFFLNVECLNSRDGGGEIEIYSVQDALSVAHELEDGKYSNVSSAVEKKCAVLIREAVAHHRDGNEVCGYVKVKGKFWGGYEWYRNFNCDWARKKMMHSLTK